MSAGSILGTVKRGTLGAMVAGIVWCGNAAANDIADVPLFLTQSVEPNILFILDDSGSMHLEIGSLIEEGTGNDNRDKERRVFPRREGPGGNTALHNATPTFEDDNRWNYRLRSAAHNPLFYDPAVEYRPWVDWQGNELDPADPENVPIDPDRPNDDVRDLTERLSEWTNWHDDDQDVDEETRSYWPITYFIYNGGDINDRDNYTRIEIRGDDLYIDGDERDDDELPSGRSIEDEIQNFANWYTYYRNRKNTARAGIGRAFLGLPDDIRVGFGRINSSNQTVDGEGGTDAVIKGVRAFDATARKNFYDDLYGTSFGGGTPLRRALKGAGEYYERRGKRGPWSSTPGVSSNPDTQLECRRSYTMLMTDGEWGGGSPGVGNVDGENGPEIKDGERVYQYTPQPPFEDDNSDMLADVAMEYWNRDLRDDLPNKVPTSETNPAFWQHMVTFTIGFGVSGELDPETDLEALASGDLDWTEHRVDDLWHAAINGRGDYLNATRPDEFTEGVIKVLEDIILRERGSSSSIATNSTRLANDSEIYQARFDSSDWSGELIAYGLNSDGSVGDAKWNAATQLEAKGPDSRNIITSKPDGTAVAFEYAQLAAEQQTELGNAAVLNWLRGHRSDGDGFRDTGILGDIVNSDPAFSGNADFGFRQLGNDTQSSGYATYLSDRDVYPTVYVGANDGMLHAFNADTGEERFAYVPASIYDHLADLPQEGYQHRYYVDGSPRVFDAYITTNEGTGWRTILIGTTGAGGRGIFALDVTDPTTFGTDDVLFDLDDGDLTHLGASIPKATVARLNDGNFWAVFGNGYGSTNEKAVLYLRNLNDGTTVTIDTGADGGNGLSSPIPVDVDGDRVTDRIYAGDLQGNLWRFDVDGNQSQWGFSNAFKQGNTPKPLFTARDSNDNVQPITARPEVGRHPDGGLMVYVGTGTYFRNGDNSVSGSDPRHSFYGIRDQDAQVAGRGALLMQEIEFEGTATFGGGGDAGTGTNQAKVRVVSDEEDASKTGGFYLDLISPVNNFEGERVVAGAQLRFGRIVFTTLIPSTDPCSFGGSSWLMELDAFDGGSYGESIFDLNEDDNFDESDYVDVGDEDEPVMKPVSGLASEVGIINKPSIITAGEVEYKYTSGSSGEVGVVKEITGSDLLGRQSWRELR